jgi:hypothetical protein
METPISKLLIQIASPKLTTSEDPLGLDIAAVLPFC